ncbi:MAG: MarR family transcriptional regulator [Phycisphaerales bacterium]|nr:MarR family transcriptional regulator [Phycisphaerales bacterium]
MIQHEDQILVALRRIIRAVDLHSRRLVEQSGLTGPQLLTLREAARLSRPSAGDLARAVRLSQATITGILDRLERRGLIERIRGDADRRSVFVVLTPRGQEILAKAPSLLQDRFCNELTRLAEWEQTLMLSILQRLASMMEAEDIEAAPMLMAGPLDAVAQVPKPTIPTPGEADLVSASGPHPAKPEAELGQRV